MACSSCPNPLLPIQCGEVRTVAVQLNDMPEPIAAWVILDCEGESPTYRFYSDSELTEEIELATVDSIVPHADSTTGNSCGNSAKADLCSPTLDAIHDMFVEQTTAINANIDEEIQAQTASINANIDEAETAIVNAIGAAADDVENAISAQTAVLGSALGDVEVAIATAGDEIESAISGQTTAINNNIDAAETAIVNAVATAGNEIEAAIGSAANTIVESISAEPNYAYAYTYNANGDVETITRTTTTPGFPPCEVQTYSYDGSDNLIGVSAWVACP